MNIRQTPARRRAALAVAPALLAALAVGAGAAPAAAVPVGPCADLRAFTLSYNTGGDDLRDNSEVIVWLTTSDRGDVELQHTWGPMSDWTAKSYNVSYQVPNSSVPSCKVTGVKVRMVSHSGPFQGADNWNMSSFSLHAYSGSGSLSYYLSATGNPVKRFTGSDPWWVRNG